MERLGAHTSTVVAETTTVQEEHVTTGGIPDINTGSVASSGLPIELAVAEAGDAAENRNEIVVTVAASGEVMSEPQASVDMAGEVVPETQVSRRGNIINIGSSELSLSSYYSSPEEESA